MNQQKYSNKNVENKDTHPNEGDNGLSQISRQYLKGWPKGWDQ